jgi:hypothetical protein
VFDKSLRDLRQVVYNAKRSDDPDEDVILPDVSVLFPQPPFEFDSDEEFQSTKSILGEYYEIDDVLLEEFRYPIGEAKWIIEQLRRSHFHPTKSTRAEQKEKLELEQLLRLMDKVENRAKSLGLFRIDSALAAIREVITQQLKSRPRGRGGNPGNWERKVAILKLADCFELVTGELPTETTNGPLVRICEVALLRLGITCAGLEKAVGRELKGWRESRLEGEERYRLLKRNGPAASSNANFFEDPEIPGNASS